MTGIQMSAACFTIQGQRWRVGRRVGTRGHPGFHPKSTTAICRGGAEASPKCPGVNCGPTGRELWLVISEWGESRRQGSEKLFWNMSQDSYGGEHAKMKTLEGRRKGGREEGRVGGRKGGWVGGQSAGALLWKERKISSWYENIGNN